MSQASGNLGQFWRITAPKPSNRDVPAMAAVFTASSRSPRAEGGYVCLNLQTAGTPGTNGTASNGAGFKAIYVFQLPIINLEQQEHIVTLKSALFTLLAGKKTQKPGSKTGTLEQVPAIKRLILQEVPFVPVFQVIFLVRHRNRGTARLRPFPAAAEKATSTPTDTTEERSTL